MSLLIYGAYGYVGELVATEAVERGFDPIVAGRDAEKVDRIAAALDCRGVAFRLDESERERKRAVTALEDAEVVLNCAGPFVRTAVPLVERCLDADAHYLDVAGEAAVFERLESKSAEASAVGRALLPGVGFDVVPTDCLAAHLVERLPDATHLALGFDAGGSLSPGTARTAIERLGEETTVREEGQLLRVAPGSRARVVDFGNGSRSAVALSLGEVSAAYYTTDVPNIETYAALSPTAQFLAEVGGELEPVFSAEPVRRTLGKVGRALTKGPSEEERRASRAYVWGEARNEETGEVAVSRLVTPNPYDVTVDASLRAADRALDGELRSGFSTPAGAFGPEFVLELDGVEGFDDE